MSGRVFIPAIHVFPADNGTSREWPAFAGHDDTGEGHWQTLLAIGQGVMVVFAWSTIFGALFLSPLALWEVGQGHVHWSFAGIGTVAYLSLLVTVLGIWIWLHALHALPARIAASSQYVQPRIGVLASAAIFGTPLGGGFALGGALVLGGIALCSLSGPHRH